MKIEVTDSDWKSIDTDLLLYPVIEDPLTSGSPETGSDETLSSLVSGLQQSKEWTPSKGNSIVLFSPRDALPGESA